MSSGTRIDPETSDGESRGSLVYDELTSVQSGVVFEETCVDTFLGEPKSLFFSLVEESMTVSFGGEETLDLTSVAS